MYFSHFLIIMKFIKIYSINQFKCNGICLLLIKILISFLSWYFEKILLILNNTCERVYHFIFLPLAKWLKKKKDLKCMYKCINVPKEKNKKKIYFWILIKKILQNMYSWSLQSHAFYVIPSWITMFKTAQYKIKNKIKRS